MKHSKLYLAGYRDCDQVLKLFSFHLVYHITVPLHLSPQTEHLKGTDRYEYNKGWNKRLSEVPDDEK